jgi:CBS-domain-containing membrane protein
VPLGRCKACKQLVALTPGAPDQAAQVVCLGSQTGEHSLLPRELPLRLPRLSVSDLMTRNVVCVRMHLTLDAVAQLFLETGLHTVPVVDPKGGVLGTVSNEDVQLAIHTERAPSDQPAHAWEPASHGMAHERCVADVMLPLVLTIPEHASVVQAAALLVVEALDRVTVVSDAGQVVGIIAASDILHWLARQDGYALPRRME